jgi:hypothetical protein
MMGRNQCVSFHLSSRSFSATRMPHHRRHASCSLQPGQVTYPRATEALRLWRLAYGAGISRCSIHANLRRLPPYDSFYATVQYEQNSRCRGDPRNQRDSARCHQHTSTMSNHGEHILRMC